MTNVEFFTDEDGNENVKIDNGDGSFTWMPKSTYDGQQAQAALSTPNV